MHRERAAYSAIGCHKLAGHILVVDVTKQSNHVTCSQSKPVPGRNLTAPLPFVIVAGLMTPVHSITWHLHTTDGPQRAANPGMTVAGRDAYHAHRAQSAAVRLLTRDVRLTYCN